MEFVVPNLTGYADVYNFFSSETFYEVIGICQCTDLNNLLYQNIEITLNENSQHEHDYWPRPPSISVC